MKRRLGSKEQTAKLFVTQGHEGVQFLTDLLLLEQ